MEVILITVDEVIMNKLKTEEGKKKYSKWVEDYIKKQNEKEQNIKAMMSNTDYFEWLVEFTKDRDEFCDDQWLYFPEEICDTDLKNVENLSLFYEAIDGYASKNYYYPVDSEFGNSYKVKLNDLGFEIGILVGQGTIFFCKKISIENDNEFIDFNDILTNKFNPQVDIINTKLRILSDIMITTYKSGVPIQAITSTLDSTINEINSQKDNNPKVMIKK